MENDNEGSGTVTLEQDFSSTIMADFPSASAYYQCLKNLVDQLKNVGAPVANTSPKKLTNFHHLSNGEIRHRPAHRSANPPTSLPSAQEYAPQAATQQAPQQSSA
ncbi:hypothetical protein LIER_42628 [Lithospermum erythrorhizon]|uniref:Uncharacterized protein n=1 Tax=Lithospermum erythrorhizon TaxID=34254 RepID=A0AAV3NPK4_LITER